MPSHALSKTTSLQLDLQASRCSAFDLPLPVSHDVIESLIGLPCLLLPSTSPSSAPPPPPLLSSYLCPCRFAAYVIRWSCVCACPSASPACASHFLTPCFLNQQQCFVKHDIMVHTKQRKGTLGLLADTNSRGHTQRDAVCAGHDGNKAVIRS